MMSGGSKTLQMNGNKMKDQNGASKLKQHAMATQQPNWFAGLRAKLSQINMPDWLSQLGIGSSNQNAAQTMSCSSTMTQPKSVLKKCSSTEDCTCNYSENFTNHLSNCSTLKSTACDCSLNVELWNNNDRSYEDTIAIQHFGPLTNLITFSAQIGKGHNFQLMFTAQPTWCDKCGDFMWGILTNAVKCVHCDYTCHVKCSSLVTLDCKTLDSSGESSSSSFATICSLKKSDPIYPDLSFLASLDESYPDDIDVTREAALEETAKEGNESTVDDYYAGSVPIHMNFNRPINVVVDQSSFSLVDSTNDLSSTKSVKTITSFFLPRNTIKNVNISNKMTTREMIVVLLRKFKVADNPRKFALYERVYTDRNEETMRKCQLTRVSDDTYLLKKVNEWKESDEVRQLVLQENDTGDILWDMFEVPELENFLLILAEEERQYLFRIRQKYDTYRYYLDQALRNHGYYVDQRNMLSCLETDHIYENLVTEC